MYFLLLHCSISFISSLTPLSTIYTFISHTLLYVTIVFPRVFDISRQPFHTGWEWIRRKPRHSNKPYNPQNIRIVIRCFSHGGPSLVHISAQRLTVSLKHLLAPSPTSSHNLIPFTYPITDFFHLNILHSHDVLLNLQIGTETPLMSHITETFTISSRWLLPHSCSIYVLKLFLWVLKGWNMN